jgi:DNA (cytosine-5)-methyltransferase 1
MMKKEQYENISDFLTVKEAAEVLGICPDTLRRWDRRGLVLAYRHPVNRYRLYKREDLENLLKQIKQPKKGGGKRK